MNAVSRNLKRLRNLAGLTQKTVAENVGVSITFIANIEQGVRMPTIHMLGKIAKVLNAAEKDFFEEGSDE